MPASRRASAAKVSRQVFGAGELPGLGRRKPWKFRTFAENKNPSNSIGPDSSILSIGGGGADGSKSLSNIAGTIPPVKVPQPCGGDVRTSGRSPRPAAAAGSVPAGPIPDACRAVTVRLRSVCRALAGRLRGPSRGNATERWCGTEGSAGIRNFRGVRPPADRAGAAFLPLPRAAQPSTTLPLISPGLWASVWTFRMTSPLRIAATNSSNERVDFSSFAPAA